jgi:hypothetical protein
MSQGERPAHLVVLSLLLRPATCIIKSGEGLTIIQRGLVKYQAKQSEGDFLHALCASKIASCQFLATGTSAKKWPAARRVRRRLVKRAQIILGAVTGTSNTSIAQHLQIDYETVRRWRDRWHAAEPRLQAVEETGKRNLLSQASEALLTDEQRPGAPATFTFEQCMRIMAASL